RDQKLSGKKLSQRSGQAGASFVECFIHRKLGFPEWLDNVQVGMVELAPGDILISGSDGRDDIELPEMINGERVINEDEFQFLRRIEEAGADLQKIYEGISGFGKIIDDFSLLKITYSHE
ncbi:MAG TPA: SpoIIE family protein phosphatase, partial [Leptospiraceae bacterium]|nr:SpoIIE family protein phosphatase [Leptospiraceae bacterium]